MRLAGCTLGALCLSAFGACGADEAPLANPTSVVATAAGAGGVSGAFAASGGMGGSSRVTAGAGGSFGSGMRAAAPTASAAGAGEVAGAPAPAAGSGGSSAAEPAAGSGGSSAAEPAAGSGSSGAPVATEKFSFFVTSLKGMQDLSKNELGFGGDLRYGEETGLAGADKICTELAELSMPGAGAKGWHAFLSTAKGGPNDGPTHAKDRIGQGPWYDRIGRVVAMGLSDLLQERPANADPVIKNDLPNERGEPNHTDTMEGADDNHDTVTASDAEGMWDGGMTCEDWTSIETPMSSGGGGLFSQNGPGVGHSWPETLSGTSWIASHKAPGCAPSVEVVESPTGTVAGPGIGNGGGYGGFYCFALMP